MSLLRRVGDALLWVLAVFGVLAGAIWVGTAAGQIKPLVVITGSMEPQIGVDALVISHPVPATEVKVGDVASLPSPRGGEVLVTHRVRSIERVAGGLEFTMRGDANGTDDPRPYPVALTDQVWQPWIVIPEAGGVVAALMRPAVAIPLAVSVLAIFALTLLPRGRPARHLAPRREAA